jgi:hypothetical protein
MTFSLNTFYTLYMLLFPARGSAYLLFLEMSFLQGFLQAAGVRPPTLPKHANSYTAYKKK